MNPYIHTATLTKGQTISLDLHVSSELTMASCDAGIQSIMWKNSEQKRSQEVSGE